MMIAGSWVIREKKRGASAPLFFCDEVWIQDTEKGAWLSVDSLGQMPGLSMGTGSSEDGKL